MKNFCTCALVLPCCFLKLFNCTVKHTAFAALVNGENLNTPQQYFSVPADQQNRLRFPLHLCFLTSNHHKVAKG